MYFYRNRNCQKKLLSTQKGIYHCRVSGAVSLLKDPQQQVIRELDTVSSVLKAVDALWDLFLS